MYVDIRASLATAQLTTQIKKHATESLDGALHGTLQILFNHTLAV